MQIAFVLARKGGIDCQYGCWGVISFVALISSLLLLLLLLLLAQQELVKEEEKKKSTGHDLRITGD